MEINAIQIYNMNALIGSSIMNLKDIGAKIEITATDTILILMISKLTTLYVMVLVINVPRTQIAIQSPAINVLTGLSINNSKGRNAHLKIAATINILIQRTTGSMT